MWPQVSVSSQPAVEKRSFSRQSNASDHSRLSAGVSGFLPLGASLPRLPMLPPCSGAATGPSTLAAFLNSPGRQGLPSLPGSAFMPPPPPPGLIFPPFPHLGLNAVIPSTATFSPPPHKPPSDPGSPSSNRIQQEESARSVFCPSNIN
ncbi:unnamed protein product [Protopolystoma xenopodis]|uniref:Uncharacterized protein n=1 Tax=Protopolystoma xenopodis TaxID=117903 RepID=A0A448XR66_9PLAT|nr:unnamed protein product [Protopolystoma xenopodis]